MAATGTAPARIPTEAPRVSPLDAANMTAGPAAKIGMGIFGVVLLVGMIYIGRELIGDLSEVHAVSIMPYLLLGLALLVALGFEFVNGFHDTANAVATVIYTLRSSRTSRWCGRAYGTSREWCYRAARWRLESFHCCRWN